MLSLFSRRHKHTVGELVLICDIGSESAGAALALISGKHKPILLAAERAALPFQREPSAKRLRPLMLRALSEAILSLLATGIPRAGLSARRLRIAEAFYILKSPWCSSRTKTLSLTHSEPFLVTEEIIAELIRHEDGSTVEQDEETEKRDSPARDTGKIFERLMTSSSLNGYRTRVPLGKEASAVSLSFFESRAPRALLRNIADTVCHFIHPRRERFHSYALASFSVVRDAFPETGDFLLVHVGGEITEALVVKKGNLLDIASFPSGSNQLIRTLCGATGPASASGLFALAREKRLDIAREKKTAAACRAVGDDWSLHFSRTLTRFSEEILPAFVYLAAESGYENIFADFIRETSAKAPARWVAPPAVTALAGDTFLSCFAAGASVSSHDLFFALESAYADRVRKEPALYQQMAG